MRVRRFDLYDSSALKPPVREKNGWLRLSGRIARVGIQEYSDASGKIRRELREPDQVFNPAAMASFSLVPLTNTHPTTLLDANTARLHAVGSVSHPVREGDWLVADMLITDARAAAALESGRQELSCGYEAEIDETPGIHPVYGPYDCRQINISGNHLALVDEARAGHEARVRLDGTDAVMLRSSLSSTSTTEQRMPEKIVINGKRIELTDANAAALQAAIDEQKAHLDAAISGRRNATLIALKWALRHMDADGDDDEDDGPEMVDCDQCDGTGKMAVVGDTDKMVACDACDGKGKIEVSSPVADEDGEEMAEEAKSDVDELEAEQETEKEAAKSHKDWKSRRDAKRKKARKDAAEKRKDGLERFKKSVRSRVESELRVRAALETEARTVLGADADLSKMDDAGVRKAVIAKAWPELKLDGKSAEALAERFAMAVEQAGGDAPAPTQHADSARGALRAPALMPAGPQRTSARSRIDSARLAREQKLSGVPFDRAKAREHVAPKKN